MLKIVIVKIKKIYQNCFNQENWHEQFIIHLAKILRPKVYIELGLYKCKLFNKLIPFCDKLIGVDINRDSGKYIKSSHKTNFFCLSTEKFVDKIRKNPLEIDLLFIDADHSQKSVLKDFENFFPFVKDQGIILLHDGYPKDKKYTQPGYCGDAYKAIEKLSRKTNEYEMTTIPLHPGLTICRKRKKQLPW